MDNNQFSQSLFSDFCPSYDYENKLIDKAFELDSNYADNLDYDFFPSSALDGYNSNSYISGLLRALGFNVEQPPNTVGFQKPVPSDSFE